MQWTWKSFDMLIVVAALAIGVAVWFIPSVSESEQMHELYEAVNERKERIAAREAAIAAEEARIEREREELGIIYIPNPFFDAPPTGGQEAGGQ